jgi:hypothetical protein
MPRASAHERSSNRLVRGGRASASVLHQSRQRHRLLFDGHDQIADRTASETKKHANTN